MEWAPLTQGPANTWAPPTPRPCQHLDPGPRQHLGPADTGPRQHLGPADAWALPTPGSWALLTLGPADTWVLPTLGPADTGPHLACALRAIRQEVSADSDTQWLAFCLSSSSELAPLLASIPNRQTGHFQILLPRALGPPEDSGALVSVC